MAYRRARRSMVGIDTAIILIAFVLVAAAVAFVVLDMGMTSAQKAKETINSGLDEASTALQVDGDVLAYVNGTGNTKGYVQDIFIPLGVTPGTGYVSFSPSLLSISLVDNSSSYANIYKGVNESIILQTNLTAIAAYYDHSTSYSDKAVAFIYFINGNITPFVLGPYGQALLVIHLPGKGLPAYTSFTVTISPSIGGAITITRIIPPDNASNTVIDLG